MEFTNSIIGAIIFVLCLAPILLLRWKRSKSEKFKLTLLNNLAKNHNCKITKHDIGFCNVIGIDEESHTVFFLKEMNGIWIEQMINLMNIQICRPKNTVHTVSKIQTVLEKVELVFVPTQKNSTEESFELFIASENFQVTDELRIANKWVELINKNLQKLRLETKLNIAQ